MISNRTRPRILGVALIAGIAGSGPFRSGSARRAEPAGSTPEASPQASPAANGGPRRVDGRYQLPDDPAATVIDLTVGNGSLPPEYQYGYEVTIDASGHAVVTISPVGSKASPVAVETTRRTVEIGEDGLQDLLAEMDERGFFALPPADPDQILVGGEVDVIEVTLADDDWTVNNWSLEAAEQRERFADAHEVILHAVGIEEMPDLGN